MSESDPIPIFHKTASGLRLCPLYSEDLATLVGGNKDALL
jgi:hypothetical protein